MYITEQNVDTLTREEARAFIRFLAAEEKRHKEDIEAIRESINYTRITFLIEGTELTDLLQDLANRRLGKEG